MTDLDPHDLFARAGTLEVPRHLDVTAVRAAGHRRLVRRRLLGGAGVVGTAAAATAFVIAVSGALAGGTGNGAPPVAGGGTPVTPDRPAASRKVDPTTTPPTPRTDPMAHWDSRWMARLVAAGVPVQTTRGFGSDTSSIESHTAVLSHGSAGYVAFLATVDPAAIAAAGKTPCALARVPKDGAGKECHQQDGAWLTTYRSSNQGPVQLARVVTGRADVVVVQSTGFPSYKPSQDGPGLLPWDLRDPYEPEQPSKHHTWPTLARQPLTTDALIALAKDLATNAPEPRTSTGMPVPAR